MALQLLIAANNPVVPQSLKQQAISVAQFAIKVANQTLKESSVASISSTVILPSPVTIVPLPPISEPILSLPPPPKIVYIPVSIPVTPPLPPSPAYPILTSEPIVDFIKSGEKYSISKVEFTADQPVRCSKDLWNNHCVVTDISFMEDIIWSCSGLPHNRFPKTVDPDMQYTCVLILTNKSGNDSKPTFTFNTPSI